MKLKDAPIQRKLMSVILLTSFVVLFLMGSAYIALEYIAYKRSLKSNVSVLGTVIASNSSASLAFDSPDEATEILNALKAEINIVAACIYDIEGNIFAIYPSGISSSFFPPVEDKNDYWFENGFLIGFQPVFQKDKRLGTLYIVSDLDAMYDQLRYFVFTGLLIILGSLFVAYFISKLLQKSISEPILALEQTAKIISEKHDYSVRANPTSTGDELGALTVAFNQMLTQIESQNQEIMTFNQNLEQKVNDRTYALKQQNDFIEAVINSSVDMIVVFDIDMKYRMINKRATDFYSIDKEKILGQKILEVFPDSKETGMYEDLVRALKGEYIHNSNYRSTVSHRFFENYYIPLKDTNEEIYGVLTIWHDITNIMEVNEKLESVNTELIKSNRDLEQFAYVASHDLQEPLRKIQTFSQLLGENINNEESIKKFHHKISQAASRMQNLIQDVLNFSRITKSEEAFIDTDLNNVLEILKMDYELMLREKSAVINHQKLPTIKGIPLQLSQLFSNIISNSLKYNLNNPVIDIHCEQMTESDLKNFPKLNPNSKYYKIDFRDNGIGFEPQFSEKIFDIFQRLHHKHTYSGTGIGLGLCKKIVENHHGFIYANSEPGRGSTFTVILPA